MNEEHAVANENTGSGKYQGKGEGQGRGGGERGRGGPGGPGGRGGPGGGRGGGRGGDRRGGRDREGREGGGGTAFRIVTELPTVEKALTTGDLAGQKRALEGILKTLRPMRLKSMDDLDLNARGRLLTTLVRVQRQPRPAGFEEFLQKQKGGPVTGSALEAAPPETQVDGGTEAAAEAQPGPEAAAPETPAEGVAEGQPVAEGEAPAGEGAAPSDDEKARGYQDVLTLVGRIWRAAGAADRAEAAFELSGRAAPEKEEPVAEGKERREERPAREGRREGREGREGRREGREGREGRERPPREGREARGEKGGKPEREKRPQREPVNIPVGGNWQEVAQQFETEGRTRDAARVHERNQSWADAARLFEAGGNPREALRCAIASKDQELVKRLAHSIPLDQARPVLEKANLWEILMERYIQAADFESVAKLYERARQFDQAGLAWEKAGKMGPARKAFERARDFKSAQRMRNLEVEKLIERGDRLGAAQMLVQANRRDEAVAILLSIPAPKAYRFMERLKLDEAARLLAKRELEKATAENKPAAKARWLEMLDENGQAAEAWAQAGRLDRASVCNEKAGNLKVAAEQAESVGELDRAQDLFRRAGDTENMDRVAKLPRPSPEERAQKKKKLSAEEEAEEREHQEATESAAAAPEPSVEAEPSEAESTESAEGGSSETKVTES